MRQHYRPLILPACLAVIAFAPLAFANSAAPTAMSFPGMIPLALGLALPASVLAAFIERPFVARAGVRTHALWYSLQANLVSLVVGYLMIPIGFCVLDGPLFPSWTFIAVGISIVTEGCYLQWRGAAESGLSLGWIAGGNVLSNIVLFLLPSAASAVSQARPGTHVDLMPYQEVLTWGVVFASLLVYALGFCLCKRRSNRAALPVASRPENSAHCQQIHTDRAHNP